jgi:hypothetical protein
MFLESEEPNAKESAHYRFWIMEIDEVLALTARKEYLG